MDRIAWIKRETLGLKHQLGTHSLYQNLNEVEDLRQFMQSHVFAVWDFMSLLKSLQLKLTSIGIPWIPNDNPEIVRFVNELVWAEESDVNQNGEARSHFEMYLEAMDEVGADRKCIDEFIAFLKQGMPVQSALEKIHISEATKNFVKFTFDIIASGKPHLIAAAFTFGREDIIPTMFIELLDANPSFKKLNYYFKRHIELDGDEHGPISLKMVAQLCGNDQLKWDEALEVSKQVLQKRIDLWDANNISITQLS